MEQQIKLLRQLLESGAKNFKEPIDIPSVAQKLDLESRRGDTKRQFKHIHQGCGMLSWDFTIACQMRVLLLIEGYLALHDAKAGLPLYSLARSAMEIHGLVLNVGDRLHEYCNGDSTDWRSRGEGFFKYLTRARWGTRDPALIEKLVGLGISKSSLEPIHSKDTEASLFGRSEYAGQKSIYARLCDYVHTNSQGFYVGSPGWFMADKVRTPNGATILFKEKGPVNRYQYPAESKFMEACEYTAEIMVKHCTGAANASDIPSTPYSEEEILAHTGTKHGLIQISTPTPIIPPNIAAGPKVGRNDPCPCGSGKKYKNCHLN